MRVEPDGPAALEIFVAAAGEIIDRHYPLYAAVRDAAADPELAEVLQRNKRLRFETHGAVVQLLALKGGLVLPVQRATEIVYTVLSQETYGLLVAEHGWGVPDWTVWVPRHLSVELFGRR